jgi:hypothetical protein
MTWTLLPFIGAMFAAVAIGTLAGWGWRQYRDAVPTEKIYRRLNVVLSVFFTLVAVLVTANLITVTQGFNEYVANTLPRDAAQEECVANAVKVLQIWAAARAANEDVEQARDNIHIEVLQTLANGQKVAPAKIDEFQNAIVATRESRRVLRQVYTDYPLPDCVSLR